MTIEEQRERILSDEAFVLSECRKIKTLYRLKHIIRYRMERTEEIASESVAEHIYATHALATYFLPLEDAEGLFDKERIYQLIEFHDIDEIETGDIVGFPKTPEEVARGKNAIPVVIKKLPGSMQPLVTELLGEYEAQQTNEARFAKALDKVEPSFQVYSEHGRKINHNVTHATYENHRRIKDPYTKQFPFIHRFSEVLSDALHDEGFFYSDK